MKFCIKFFITKENKMRGCPVKISKFHFFFQNHPSMYICESNDQTISFHAFSIGPLKKWLIVFAGEVTGLFNSITGLSKSRNSHGLLHLHTIIHEAKFERKQNIVSLLQRQQIMSTKPCASFFIQTLPRILSSGAISHEAVCVSKICLERLLE